MSRFFPWYMVFFEALIGTLFILGLATQIAALLSILLSLKLMYLSPRLFSPHVPPRLFWVLVCGISLSLFITGAGVFAFDLPL